MGFFWDTDSQSRNLKVAPFKFKYIKVQRHFFSVYRNPQILGENKTSVEGIHPNRMVNGSRIIEATGRLELEVVFVPSWPLGVL